MEFSSFGNRSVLGAFDGGEITSDAGILLLREAAARMNLFSRMSECFTDHRDQGRVQHQLSDLLSQRVTGIALGYEDLNDHDELRADPALKLLGNAERISSPSLLAGSSTLGRLEQSPQNGKDRYQKIVPSLKALSNLLPELFIECHDSVPERIILDIDATDIKAHRRQEGSFFNGYYEHRCFMPLYVFCGPHLLLAQLRPSDIDGAKGARNVIRRLVTQIRCSWPKMKILVRGDSGFVRENLLHWCESNHVDYIFGLARNDYLLKKAQKIRSKAAAELLKTNEFVKMYGHFTHMPKTKTWARPRHVIAKVQHKPGQEQRCRFLVTSLDWNKDWVIELSKIATESFREKKQKPPKDLMPKVIYEKIYCPRGDMENRIKDCQLDLFGDRASCHAYKANQLRLTMAGFAYVLTTYIRLKGLVGTELAKAVPGTIRTKLFKIGAKITTSVRRIKISMADAYPYKHIFFRVWQNLCAIPIPAPT